MESTIETGPRTGSVRPELGPLVAGVEFLPERVQRDEVDAARKVLTRDGAAILTGWPVEADSPVHAAAAVLGTRLRELEQLQPRSTEDTRTTHQGPSPGLLHRDGATIAVEINDRPVSLRLADPDYVLILCASPAPSGGGSVLVDGHRLVERIESRAPELYEFLTTVDVDSAGRNANPDTHRALPRVHRLVEWTRGGRMMLRVGELARPVPREPQWAEHEDFLQLYTDLCATLADQIRTETALAAGEVLVVDNYRCLHGVRGHDGRRSTYVLRCRSRDAR